MLADCMQHGRSGYAGRLNAKKTDFRLTDQKLSPLKTLTVFYTDFLSHEN